MKDISLATRVPRWAREFGLTEALFDKFVGIINRCTRRQSRERAILRLNEYQEDRAIMLNALEYCEDKGLIK